MSLHTVVNKLVRAAASVPTDISDADLDRHVAQLLADEAKAREVRWGEMGLSALIDSGRSSPDASAPKPNKRFLASIIRTVDGHNKDLLRSQAQAAREAREEKYGESSRSGRSGASRLFGGALRDMRGSAGRPERRDREGHGRQRSVSPARDTRGPDGRTDARKRTERERSEGYGRGERRGRHQRSRERDEHHPDGHRSVRDTEARDRRHQRRPKSPPSPDRLTRTVPAKGDRSDPSTHHSTRRSLSPPSPRPPPLSKMDKYFTETYDPRIDVGDVPPEGMIADVGWDNMLAVLKERGQKRRRHSPGLLDDPYDVPAKAIARSASPDEKAERRRQKDERRRRRAEDSDEEWERQERRRKRKEKREEVGPVVNVMGMQYTSQGGVREWDKDK